MAVRFEHLAHIQPLAELEEAVVFVRRIEQHRVAGLLAPQHVHVVVHGADDDLVDLRLAVLVVERICH